ncbi:hypothetical protein E2562_018730 [Oryza meyeriana var. granulata]|uniref:Uncharacterized protein n=1 Tax=Oryza meyeriana var. granulata TaxID=110450 RepID=A0A6G1EMS1_9ORYZ|nr:hypothetical protein E2562_018730 [Oryza meyeriana var. granulata]
MCTSCWQQHQRAVRLGSHRQRDLPPVAFKLDDEGKVPLQRDGGLRQGARRLGLEGDGSARKGGGRQVARSRMGMGGVRLQASCCFVRSSKSILYHGLSACRCPGNGSSELDDTEDDGGVSKSEEAEQFHQGRPSLPSMSA